jgi:CheY-like chemotaxis protein/HPt (histidine-containing phosphotransfer) domain-containing protein
MYKFSKPVRLLYRLSFFAVDALIIVGSIWGLRQLALGFDQNEQELLLSGVSLSPTFHLLGLFGPPLLRIRIARLRLQALLLLTLALLSLVSGLYRLLAHSLNRQARELQMRMSQLVELLGEDPQLSSGLKDPDESLQAFYRAIAALFQQPALSAHGSEPAFGQPTRAGACKEPPAPVPHTEQLQILLVDDNQLNQQVVLLLLESLGHHADLASNGVDALDAVVHQRYDLILMDIQMPEMDGLEATRTICEIYPVLERPYIIAITANTMQGDREQCLAAGMDDYMTKPIQITELQGALERAVRGIEQRVHFGTQLHYEPPIDKHVLEELRLLETEEQPNVVSVLIKLFMKEAAPLLEEVRSGVIHAEGDRVRRAAHSLKSSSASLGAHVLSSLSAELEKCGRSNTLQHALPIVRHLELEYARVCQALEREQRGCV